VRAAREELVGCALDEAADHFAAGLVLHAVERRHQLVGGVERKIGDARELRPRLLGIEPALLREHDERALGRVSDQLAVRDDGVGGEHHRQHELLERYVRLARDALDHAFRRVAAARDRVAAPGDRQLDGRHLVERQRPGLVGVDRRRRAERLRRAEALHDRIRPREHLRAEREDRRHDRG
jgi:hypothetical protein